MSPPPPRAPGRRTPSLPRQAVEGIGIVTLLSLGGAALGFAVALLVSWLY